MEPMRSSSREVIELSDSDKEENYYSVDGDIITVLRKSPEIIKVQQKSPNIAHSLLLSPMIPTSSTLTAQSRIVSVGKQSSPSEEHPIMNSMLVKSAQQVSLLKSPIKHDTALITSGSSLLRRNFHGNGIASRTVGNGVGGITESKTWSVLSSGQGESSIKLKYSAKQHTPLSTPGKTPSYDYLREVYEESRKNHIYHEKTRRKQISETCQQLLKELYPNKPHLKLSQVKLMQEASRAVKKLESTNKTLLDDLNNIILRNAQLKSRIQELGGTPNAADVKLKHVDVVFLPSRPETTKTTETPLPTVLFVYSPSEKKEKNKLPSPLPKLKRKIVPSKTVTNTEQLSDQESPKLSKIEIPNNSKNEEVAPKIIINTEHISEHESPSKLMEVDTPNNEKEEIIQSDSNEVAPTSLLKKMFMDVENSLLKQSKKKGSSPPETLPSVNPPGTTSLLITKTLSTGIGNLVLMSCTKCKERVAFSNQVAGRVICPSCKCVIIHYKPQQVKVNSSSKKSSSDASARKNVIKEVINLDSDEETTPSSESQRKLQGDCENEIAKSKQASHKVSPKDVLDILKDGVKGYVDYVDGDEVIVVLK